jgi:lipopolysaccharide/colanic/teichoic acid biosynthesis glycosyltransferase
MRGMRMSELLVSDFLNSSAGYALFSVIIVILAILILDLNYKFFAKSFLDRLFSFIALVVLSPLFLVTTIVVKVREGDVISYSQCAGKDGKLIYVRSFCGNYGWLNSLPKLVDVLLGKLSIVGPSIMRASDVPFISDDKMARFDVKPGLISPLSIWGYEEITYDEMFALDIKYVKKREMFKDIFIVLGSLFFKLRGEGDVRLGKTRDKSYSGYLLENGTITEEDLQTAKKYIEHIEINSKF